MISYSLINNSKDLIELTDSFLNRGIETVAMDFEEESNLHVYGEHLCVIQLFDREYYYLIDAWKIQNYPDGAAALKYFLESPIEKIMFGCSSDAAIVRKTLGIQLKNVCDVRVMAQALEFMGNLTALIQRNLNIVSEDSALKKKYQRANWMKRPIPEEQIQYALSDVKYLFDLKASLEEEIKTQVPSLQKRVAIEMKHCAEQKHKEKPGWEKICNFKALGKREKVFIRYFFMARDSLARKANMPPTNILEKQLLVSMAKAETWEGTLDGPKLRYSGVFEQARLNALKAIEQK